MTRKNSTPLNHHTHLLLRGLYARVARKLNLDPSYVSRVVRGERASAAVQAALEKEFEDIARRGRLHLSKGKKGSKPHPSRRGSRKTEETPMRSEELGWIQSSFMAHECDFCHDGNGMKSYGCRNFEYEGNRVVAGKTVNLLAACLDCAQLIDSEAWPELTERVFEEFLERNGVRRKEAWAVRMRIEEIHQMFREHLVSAGHS